VCPFNKLVSFQLKSVPPPTTSRQQPPGNNSKRVSVRSIVASYQDTKNKNRPITWHEPRSNRSVLKYLPCSLHLQRSLKSDHPYGSMTCADYRANPFPRQGEFVCLTDQGCCKPSQATRNLPLAWPNRRSSNTKVGLWSLIQTQLVGRRWRPRLRMRRRTPFPLPTTKPALKRLVFRSSHRKLVLCARARQWLSALRHGRDPAALRRPTRDDALHLSDGGGECLAISRARWNT
jgi:hypothetical protein